jgi:dihydrofolate reductase
MSKIITSTMVSGNSVMENPQNWSYDYMSEDLLKYVYDQLFASDSLIMGRITYEGFADAWSSRAGADAFADRINAMPKHVASRTQKTFSWNASLIEGDVAAEVAKLKKQPGQDILQYGMGELTHLLVENGLVDEIRLLVYPVMVGEGLHVFEKVPLRKMKLLETHAFSSGVVALHYKPE